MKLSIKDQAVRRLKIITGQIKGLEKQVCQEKYCIDIINLSLAVREALVSFEKLILENHLETHVAEQMKTGKTNRAVKEIVSIYNRVSS